MPRKRRVAKVRRRALELTDAERTFLETGTFDASGARGDEALALTRLSRDPRAWRELWARYRDEILDDWIAEHPGTRPESWWRFDAPEPTRRRLRGVGTPAHEALAYVPQYDAGIPARWVTAWDVAYYTGRAVDVDGRPIGQEFTDQTFAGHAIDPADPPRYESEAAYLARHGLLSADERRRVAAGAFDDEVVLGDAELP